jgi:adenosylhomocysteine nucleosidase
MDARPLLKEFEIPLLKKSYFETDQSLLFETQTKLQVFFESPTFQNEIKNTLVAVFGEKRPRLYVGDIASGDHFFSTIESKNLLSKKLPDVLCVEMEGAAVAQVCHEYQIPFLVIRIISDALNDQTTVDFQSFVEKIASKYSQDILSKIIE